PDATRASVDSGDARFDARVGIAEELEHQRLAGRDGADFDREVEQLFPELREISVELRNRIDHVRLDTDAPRRERAFQRAHGAAEDVLDRALRGARARAGR